MNIKLKQLVEGHKSLEKVIELLSVEPKLALEVAIFLNEVEDKVSAFNKIRDILLKEYGAPDEKDKRMYNVPLEKTDEFLSKLGEMLEKEYDLEVPKLTSNDFGEKKLNPKDLKSITWMFSNET